MLCFCEIPSDSDSDLDSLVGDSCLTDFGSNISDEDSSSVGEWMKQHRHFDQVY